MKGCKLFVEIRNPNLDQKWYYWKSYRRRSHAIQAAENLIKDFPEYKQRLWKIEDSGTSIFIPS